MIPSSETIEALRAMGLDGQTVVSIVTLIVRDVERDVERDGRDAKALAAARARRYRATKSGKTGMAGQYDADGASRLPSRQTSRSERDAVSLNLTSLPVLVGEPTEEKGHSGRKKEVITRATPLPDDWQPNPAHHATAERLKLPAGTLERKAEDMRLWAQANGTRKKSWDAQFHAFLRRSADDLGAANGPGRLRTLQGNQFASNRTQSLGDRARELADQARELERAAGMVRTINAQRGN